MAIIQFDGHIFNLHAEYSVAFSTELAWLEKKHNVDNDDDNTDLHQIICSAFLNE